MTKNLTYSFSLGLGLPVEKPAKSYQISAPEANCILKEMKFSQEVCLKGLGRKDRFKPSSVLSDVNATLHEKGLKWA